MAKGNGFAVCTMKKQTGRGGGLSAHIDREVYDPKQDKMIPFRPASVRDDSRTALNRECIESSMNIGRTQAIWERLSEAGFSRRKDDEVVKKKKTRKIKDNAVIALCFVCTSDEETMKKLEKEGKLDAWIKKNIEWFQREFGKENVVSAMLHMDETTPHLHITVVPITTAEAKERKEKPKFDENGNPIKKYETDKNGKIILDEKGRAIVKKRSYKKQKVSARLSAKDICNPLAMNRWQTEYAEAMKEFGMKRGIVGSKQKNVPPAEWNLQQLNGQLVAVEKEVQQQKGIKEANDTFIEKQKQEIRDNQKKMEELEDGIVSKAKKMLGKSDEKALAIVAEKADEERKEAKKMLGDVMRREERVAQREKKLTLYVENALEEGKKVGREEALDEVVKSARGLDINVPMEEKAAAIGKSWRKRYDEVKGKGEEIRKAVEEGKKETEKKFFKDIEKLKDDHKKEMAEAEKAFNKDGKPVVFTTGPRKGQQASKQELIESLAAQLENLREEFSEMAKRFREAKTLLSAMLSGNYKKVVDIILAHLKKELREFSKEAKEALQEIIFGAEKSVKGRKAYFRDAFKEAELEAKFDLGWEIREGVFNDLKEDAERIAEGTWEEYHKDTELEDAAVEAVANLANTPNRRYWEKSDIDAVNDWLDSVPDGERSDAVAELERRAWEEYHIDKKEWLGDVMRRIENGDLGMAQGRGL